MKKASKVVVGSVDVVPVEGRRAVRGDAVERRRILAATAAAHAQAAWQSWYVLMVTSGREIDVQRALADRLGAVSMVPIGVRWKRVAKHVQATTVRERAEFVLFAGYVFVEGYSPAMLELPDVYGFVGVGAPAVVPASVLAAFAAASGRYGLYDETQKEAIDPAMAAYDALARQVGRMVSVMEGPFAGQVGLLRAVRHSGVGLARIEMRAMGRAVGVDVPTSAVDAVGAA